MQDNKEDSAVDKTNQDGSKSPLSQVSRSSCTTNRTPTSAQTTLTIVTPITDPNTRRRMYPRIDKVCPIKTLLNIGDSLKERWVVKGLIGSGGYGQIYYCFDNKAMDHVAVKVEPTKRKGKTVRRMILEQKVLLRLQGRAHIAMMYGSGVERDMNYIVLQLLSVNIGELRKQCPLKRFSKSTAGRIMIQALAGVRDIHQIGFLHRDLKPANMCFGITETSKHRLIIVDFGLVRKYVDNEGRVKPRRDRAGFRGTLRYVSIRVHDREEQGPSDDLVSLLYSLIELIRGELPWRKMCNSDEIRMSKEELVNDEYQAVSAPFGEVMQEFSLVISRMSPDEEPNFRELQEYMRELSGRKSLSDPYDWECNYQPVFDEGEINRELKIAV